MTKGDIRDGMRRKEDTCLDTRRRTTSRRASPTHTLAQEHRQGGQDRQYEAGGYPFEIQHHTKHNALAHPLTITHCLPFVLRALEFQSFHCACSRHASSPTQHVRFHSAHQQTASVSFAKNSDQASALTSYQHLRQCHFTFGPPSPQIPSAFKQPDVPKAILESDILLVRRARTITSI